MDNSKSQSLIVMNISETKNEKKLLVEKIIAENIFHHSRVTHVPMSQETQRKPIK